MLLTDASANVSKCKCSFCGTDGETGGMDQIGFSLFSNMPQKLCGAQFFLGPEKIRHFVNSRSGTAGPVHN